MMDSSMFHLLFSQICFLFTFTCLLPPNTSFNIIFHSQFLFCFRFYYMPNLYLLLCSTTTMASHSLPTSGVREPTGTTLAAETLPHEMNDMKIRDDRVSQLIIYFLISFSTINDIHSFIHILPF